MIADLIERLNDVLDIIVAAEQQFAKTEAHHAYYSDRFAAVQKAIDELSAASAIALAWKLHSKEDEARADDFLIGDGCVMAFSQWVGHELAPILRERGLWSGERDPLDKLRDMAALSHAAINAMHSWNARAEGDAQ